MCRKRAQCVHKGEIPIWHVQLVISFPFLKNLTLLTLLQEKFNLHLAFT